ncbi:hypothetical protein I7I50_00313 [Histoplasma capsulatum G186AR]|uniref:Uncharacterized protein n=1 Tax=Ajellomyces capsulatus TaxID=5037 RepID=A0A8H7YG67_AJECA|nr:hypothetical protein I7I52_07581 [Histoplasma capsulatum]QSS72459.1 hypothetical protein I7I50_00313 [Histoplasma capsulatum G186AR]
MLRGWLPESKIGFRTTPVVSPAWSAQTARSPFRLSRVHLQIQSRPHSLPGQNAFITLLSIYMFAVSTSTMSRAYTHRNSNYRNFPLHYFYYFWCKVS